MKLCLDYCQLYGLKIFSKTCCYLPENIGYILNSKGILLGVITCHVLLGKETVNNDRAVIR